MTGMNKSCSMSTEPQVAALSSTAGWSEYRPVSAMFVDLEDSVEMIGRLGPETYNAALRAFHNLVTVQVRMFNGEVAQYLGDGVMCLFHRGCGALGRAAAAIAAGISIAEAMRRPGAPCAANVRVGIASGPALFSQGSSAAGVRAVGNCINLAARLQGAARPGCVLICGESRRGAEDLFDLQPWPLPRLKGFAEEQACWQVCAAQAGRGDRAERRGGGSDGPPLVGREQDLLELEVALARAMTGQGQTVAIMGEGGLGKTRLLQEFLCRAQTRDCARLVLNCNRYERGGDYHPIKSYLHWIAGVEIGDDDITRAGKLRQVFSAVWGLAPRAIDDMLLLLDAHPDRDARLSGDAVVLRRWLCDELTARLIEMQGVFPALVIVVEDAHWLDPSSTEFLAGLQAALKDRPALLVFSQRSAGPEDMPVLPAQRVLRLAPLSGRQSRVLIDSLLGGHSDDQAMVDWIRGKARGVPLFLSAFADYALRRGKSDFGAPDLPLDLLDLLEQSLGHLPEPTRRFAQAAAVMGPTFRPELIAALLDEDEDQTDQHVQLLMREKLAGERPGIPGLTFAHDLVSEAIYGNLGAELCRRLHADMARTMQARWPEAPAHVLALHFERAGQPARAVGQLILATLAAVRVGALHEARGHLGRAFALLKDLPDDHERRRQELALCSLEGPLQMMLGGPGNRAFGTAQRRSMELMHELGLSHDRAHLFYNSGLHEWACGRLDAAEAISRTVLALPNEDDGAQLGGHTLAGLVAWHKGDLVGARHHLGCTIALYRVEQHAGLFPKYLKDFGVFSMFYSALTASVAGRFDEARAFAARAGQLGESLGIAHPRCFALLAEFLSAMFRDDVAATLDYAQRAEALARRHCFPEFVAMAVFAQGWAQTRRPATHRAGLEAMIQGLEGWRRTNFIAWQCLFEAMVIEELVKAGRLADAMRYLVPLKARLAATGEAQFLVPALLAEARCLAAQNQGRPALECLDRAATHADNAGACLWQQRTWQVRDDLAGSGA